MNAFCMGQKPRQQLDNHDIKVDIMTGFGTTNVIFILSEVQGKFLEKKKHF